MIRIAIVDDESLVASSLATLLGLEDDLEVAVVAGSGEELVEWWRRGQQADVCVCDLQMGGIDGIETARRIRELSPGAGVLIVTSHARPRALKQALAAGVLGFLPKTSTAVDFATAIRAVHAGRRHLDPELAALTISAGESPLSEREAELLELAGQGGSIEDIASAVHLAAGTTRNYLSSAMAKVGAQNRFEAYTRARERGWI
ncbi:response regulator transcription factor [Corynebacterium sp.]|uniref:response regulator transcription factor n=1 Tax=Corynebacterium sp. TaxID=1720 RepID=UPI0026DF6B14|nr:response regulator transcription factor [Corynebacterium sp.]MDO5512218.1 response regulator transcription factor [Corynebacterium sp.]